MASKGELARIAGGKPGVAKDREQADKIYGLQRIMAEKYSLTERSLEETIIIQETNNE